VATQTYTATTLGRWLGCTVRAVVAALLLGGLLGAALGAARHTDVTEFVADLSAGRVSDLVVTGGRTYTPGLDRGGSPDQVVRWRTDGAGWRVADLNGVRVDGPGLPSMPASEADVRRLAATAGVPVAERMPGPAATLVRVATVTSIVLVVLMIGGPQPRRATKWAWFWLLLVPGGLTQLAWIAVEAPWSRRANRRPEPPPHRRDVPDGRLTGGWSFLFAFVLGGVLTVLGTAVASWLAG
jgi:hypothetical protein